MKTVIIGGVAAGTKVAAKLKRDFICRMRSALLYRRRHSNRGRTYCKYACQIYGTDRRSCTYKQ